MIAGIAAGLLALSLAFEQLFWGGRDVGRPLRRATALPNAVRATAWTCWHKVTASLFAMALLLLWGAAAGRPDLVLAGAILASGVAIAGIAAAPILGVGYRTLPQGWLFVPVVVLAGWSLWA